jgi:hypothetical protein
VGPWFTNRCTYGWAPLVPILLMLTVASAQESQSPRDERVEEPVIRASELLLKDATTIAAVSGVVRITRNGDILKPSVGASIEAGDLVQVTPNASLTLRSARGIITLTSEKGQWFKFVR